jgi:phage gpG-like protein
VAGATITIDDKRVRRMLQEVERRLDDATPAYRDIGEIVLSSIQRNFEAGGRPKKWEASKRAEEEGGQTLVDKAVLKNSLNVKPGRTFVKIGTADVRAAVLNFGAEAGSFGTFEVQVREHVRKMGGKSHTVKAHARKTKLPWGDIPGREFMLVQDEDVDEILATLGDYLDEAGREA